MVAKNTGPEVIRKPGSPILPILIAVVVLLVGAWVVRGLQPGDGQPNLLPVGQKPKNILLMGVDEEKTRTDVLILAHIDPKRKHVSLVSIPRDTLVEIPCERLSPCLSPDKVNHAHAYGGEKGPELTVKAVQTFLGVPVDGYVRVDFAGFAKLVDSIGGVDLVIEKDMYYTDPAANPPLVINFRASSTPQHLNGEAALRYIRYRSDGLGDIGRTARTRTFLVAVVKSLRESGVISSLPKMISDLLPYVKTNVDLSTLVALARIAPHVDPSQVEMAGVPGSAIILADGRWVWQANPEATQELVDRLIKQKIAAAQ